MACPVALASQRVWVDKHQYVDAERKLHSKVILRCIFSLYSFYNWFVSVSFAILAASAKYPYVIVRFSFCEVSIYRNREFYVQ